LQDAFQPPQRLIRGTILGLLLLGGSPQRFPKLVEAPGELTDLAGGAYRQLHLATRDRRHEPVDRAGDPTAEQPGQREYYSE
jgi:hypothetical protein